MNLIVVGSVGLDDVETPFGRVDRALGGSAIYFSLAASFFAKVGFVGVVGEDFPESGVEMLKSHGIDVAGLDRVPGNTFRWGGKYGFDLNHRDTLFTELNVFESFKPRLPTAYKEAPYVFLGNILPSLQLEVLDQVEKPAFVAMDTMNLWIDIARPDLMRVLERVDALFVNDAEARQLAGCTGIVEAAAAIRTMGPKIVVIKRGEYGALIAQGDQYFYAPAFPLERVVDPTGAGDAFAGGFMGWIARTRSTSWPSLCQAVVAGSTMASFTVEDFSVGRLRAIDPSTVAGRAAQFRAITHFEPLPTLG